MESVTFFVLTNCRDTSETRHGLAPIGLEEMNVSSPQSDIPTPLVIGVTGHRDLREQDYVPLQNAVRKIFLELRDKYGATSLILLSALADGADRLAAEVAVSEEIQAQLFVPLPMEQSLYERDFSAESLRDFRAFLGKAKGYVEMPVVEGNTLDGISQNGPQRDLQYQSVGQYIVRNCQILIAMWDGVEGDLVGGTACVVKFQRQGLPQLEKYSFEALEGFPVYRIVTPRKKNPNPSGTRFERQELYPFSFDGDDVRAKAYYERMFSRINEFNRYATRPDAALCREAASSKSYFLRGAEDPPRALLHEEQFSRGLQAELNRYSLADALARRCQREKVRFDKFLHWMMFLAFLSFVVFAHLIHRPALLMFSMLLAGIGAVARSGFRKFDGDTRFEDYRAMAEGLRVRFFWMLIGLSDFVTDYYFGKQRSELDWIRNVFRGWEVHSRCVENSPGNDLSDPATVIRTHWLEDQKAYFHGARERETKRLEGIEFWSKALIVFALLFGLALLVRACHQVWPDWWSAAAFAANHDWQDPYIVIVEMSLAGAALLHNYGNRMAYREHAKQYTRMEGVFSRALSVFAGVNDQESAVACIKSLGREALRENGDWVLLHRERPLDVPHP
jgi:hypothetical protein